MSDTPEGVKAAALKAMRDFGISEETIRIAEREWERHVPGFLFGIPMVLKDPSAPGSDDTTLMDQSPARK